MAKYSNELIFAITNQVKKEEDSFVFDVANKFPKVLKQSEELPTLRITGVVSDIQIISLPLGLTSIVWGITLTDGIEDILLIGNSIDKPCHVNIGEVVSVTIKQIIDQENTNKHNEEKAKKDEKPETKKRISLSQMTQQANKDIVFTNEIYLPILVTEEEQAEGEEETTSPFEKLITVDTILATMAEQSK